MASGVKQAIEDTGQHAAGRAVLWPWAAGVALFLAGSAAFRHALRIGTQRYRLAAAAVARGRLGGGRDAERGGRDGCC